MEQRELKPGGASIPVTRYVVFLKFIYSEEATKFWEILTFLLSYVVPVKSKVNISQDFVALSEYMNFNTFNKSAFILTIL